MTISDMYDIDQIVLNIEAALKIDGKDYGEKDVEVIFENVRNRIIVEYKVDLHDKQISDESLYIGPYRDRAMMFVENMAMLHAQLCGWLQIARFTTTINIRPININYMGFAKDSMLSLFIAAMGRRTQPDCAVAMKALQRKFGAVNNCIEKKLILIMLICYEFGFNEIVASIADIFYIGGKTA